jgi:hypothetical protein
MAVCFLKFTAGHNYPASVRDRALGILLALFSGASSDEIQTGFDKLPKGAAKNLYRSISGWIAEWKDTLQYMVDRELVDDVDIQRLLDVQIGIKGHLEL